MPPTYPPTRIAEAAVKGAQCPTPQGVDGRRSGATIERVGGVHRPIPIPRPISLDLESCCVRPSLR